MAKLFTTAHVAELHSIEAARLRRGQPGIGDEVEELIRRLTSGGVAGKSDDIRVIQAKRLWDLGVGRELGLPNFNAYLATIPEIPAELVQDGPDYPHLVLVETRVGLKRLCYLGSIDFSGDDQTFIEHDERHREFAEPTWIRVQDGRKNRNRAVRDCRNSFVKDELGLTALQGVCSYLQYPNAVVDTSRSDRSPHVMDLSGSVQYDCSFHAAYLAVSSGRAELSWFPDDRAAPQCGSASRWERKAT